MRVWFMWPQVIQFSHMVPFGAIIRQFLFSSAITWPSHTHLHVYNRSNNTIQEISCTIQTLNFLSITNFKSRGTSINNLIFCYTIQCTHLVARLRKSQLFSVVVIFCSSSHSSTFCSRELRTNTGSSSNRSMWYNSDPCTLYDHERQIMYISILGTTVKPHLVANSLYIAAIMFGGPQNSYKFQKQSPVNFMKIISWIFAILLICEIIIPWMIERIRYFGPLGDHITEVSLYCISFINVKMLKELTLFPFNSSNKMQSFP